MSSMPSAFRTLADVDAARATIVSSRARTAAALRGALDDPDPLARMKFEPLGCDPADPERALNLIDEINIDATWSVTLDALAVLCTTLTFAASCSADDSEPLRDDARLSSTRSPRSPCFRAGWACRSSRPPSASTVRRSSSRTSGRTRL